MTDPLVVGVIAFVAGFVCAVLITLPALKRSAREVEMAEAEMMVIKRALENVPTQQKQLIQGMPPESKVDGGGLDAMRDVVDDFVDNLPEQPKSKGG